MGTCMMNPRPILAGEGPTLLWTIPEVCRIGTNCRLLAVKSKLFFFVQTKKEILFE